MKLPELKNKKTVLLCVGNEMRGDDAFGPALGHALKESLNFKILDGGEVPESMTGKINAFKPDFLIIADAADFGGQVGELKFIDEADIMNAALSTHSLPLSLMMRFIRAENPGVQVYFLAAQLKSAEFGGEMSMEMRNAVLESAALLNGVL